jgi:hypothetical protein
MSSLRIPAAIAVCVLLASCTPPPEKTIEKDCVRLGLLSQIDAGADAKTSCSCLAGKLKDSMSEKDLEAFAKALKDTKKAEDFESTAEEHGLSDAAGMAFLGAAKSCAIQ